MHCSPEKRAFCLKNNTDADKMKLDKAEYMRIKPIYTKEHFRKIAESDAIVVVNEEKHGIKGYIGGATFSELMLAFHYDKKIFLLNPIPKDKRLDFVMDEIQGVNPIVLDGNLALIENH